MTYKEKLLDPRWQKRRLEILERDCFECRLCSDTKTTLHIHHYSYRNIEPWEYENHELVTYCKHCHAVIEFENKKEEITPVLVIKKRTKIGYRLYLIYYDSSEDLMIDVFKFNECLEYIVSISGQTIYEVYKILVAPIHKSEYLIENISDAEN